MKAGKSQGPVLALAANEKGEIFELEGYAAVGWSGGSAFPLNWRETIPMPRGGELMFLPQRRPVVFDLSAKRLVTLRRNPFAPREEIFPVSAFNSPGWIVTALAAWEEEPGAAILPLFSYGACGWSSGGIRSAALRVDRERRQDLLLMPPEKVAAGVARERKLLPGNRLARHLEKCALTYGCPAAKNYFIGRCEAPLPTASACNARCLGCLSLQKEGEIPESQQRIAFTPSPDEIAGVALSHLSRVPGGVVSFGQGCEGDPLLAAGAIAPAIRLIREKTGKGTININTNAGRPDLLEKIIAAGADSMRVSINSVRKECYTAYFRPGYDFARVLESIDLALSRGLWVSLNYLNQPGFTDSPEEAGALLRFLSKHRVHMIQWRNLNFDPPRYRAAMEAAAPMSRGMGIPKLLDLVKKEHPRLVNGYFNPALRP